MIRCIKCKRFMGNKNKITYKYNKWTDEIKDVYGMCKHCGKVEVEYDAFEDIREDK